VGTTEAELKRHAEQDRARLGETLEAIGDRLSPQRVAQRRKAAVGQGFRHLRESVMGSPGYVEPVTQRARAQTQHAAASAADAAKSAASRATDTARSAAETVQHTPDMLAEQTRGNPLAAGLIAFGTGLLIATAFPTTRTEQQLVDHARPELDQAKEELTETGRELAGDAKELATSAAQDVASVGKEAASNVAGQARSSAQQVAQETRQPSP
jgi:gas vesicle protein